MMDVRRRVTLHVKNAEGQWDAVGTGHVSVSYVERLKGISLLVQAECDGSCVLESKIYPETKYQKLQGTVIVWCQGEHFDNALSFEKREDRDEIWEQICQVKGGDSSVGITQDTVEEYRDEHSDNMLDSAPWVKLPPCELSRLEEIRELIGSNLSYSTQQESLFLAIKNRGYIRKLLNLFHMCESSENMAGLHYLYEIFKNIFMLNKYALFEVMFGEETIFDVLGCLEYDPTSPSPKRHRQYLKELARYKEVIPITNPKLLAKIHQTHRVQYIQDVVLPTLSAFDNDICHTLSSFIFYNKVDIVMSIQEEEEFLSELFAFLTNEATDDLKRRDLILFLKEFCGFSQEIEHFSKEVLYKRLNSLGILLALEISLGADDPQTKTASVDILTYIVEFSPSIVHDYMLQQINNSDKEHVLINVIIEQMLCGTDPEHGGAAQLMGIVTILLDPEKMLASFNKSEEVKFLNYFYQNSVHIMIGPLLVNTVEDSPANEDNQTVEVLGLILELLSFCVEHHEYHIKNCILIEDLLRRILILMKSTHSFLVLCALRFMRKIIALKDEFYNIHIIKGNLFAPVVDAFVRNNGRYNMLDSAILEMFEFIKLEDIRSLHSHVVENFGKTLENIDYVKTFKTLKLNYEKHQEKLSDGDQTALDSSCYQHDPRQVEEEEEKIRPADTDDLDGGDIVVPATNEILEMRVDSELDVTGKIIDEATDRSVPKLINSTKPSNIVNDVCGNTTGSSSPTPAAGDVKSTTVLKKGSSKKGSTASGRRRTFVHSGETPFKGSHREKSFHQSSHFSEHMLTHRGQRSYKCSRCGKSFSTKTNLILHMHIHLSERPYKCSVCEKSFRKKTNLMVHMLIHLDEKPYTCSQCNESFSTKTDLIVHMQIHLSLKPYKCSQCEKSFHSKSNLLFHMHIHLNENPYKCSRCEKSFTAKRKLIAHMGIHLSENPFMCSRCEKSFSTKNKLIAHMHIHLNEKPYMCSQCDESFSTKNNLILHMHIHMNEKPYKCSQCDKSFGTKSNLILHMHIHLSEKLFMCGWCDKSFSTKNNLIEHMHIHLSEKYYNCSQCDKSFSTKSNLMVHMHIHLSEKP